MDHCVLLKQEVVSLKLNLVLAERNYFQLLGVVANFCAGIDLRNPGTVLYSLQGRQSGTNQRIQFGIAPNGKQIVSGICIYDYIIKWYKLVKFMFFILLGGTDGSIAAWELQQANDSTDLNIIQKIELSRDSINGISLHNTLPIIATSTGQRLCGNATEYRDHNVRLWRFA